MKSCKQQTISFEEHNEIGARLQEFRNYLISLECILQMRYSDKKLNSLSYAATNCIDSLRCMLDDLVCEEFIDKEDHEVCSVYYRNGTDR